MGVRFNRALEMIARQPSLDLENNRHKQLQRHSAAQRKSVNEVLRERLVNWIDSLPNDVPVTAD